jgi:predicted GNAT superfamily acetyltransferase
MIRPLEAADLDRVLELNQANVPEVGSIDRARLEFLVAESVIALVATAADDGDDNGGRRYRDTVVGFCLVLGEGSAYDSVNYRWFVDRYTDFAYLDRVAIDEAARGRGLGRALYDEVDRRMQAIEGADRLALEINVDPPNEPSLRFHERLGFVEVGQQDTPYGIRVSMQLRSTGIS